MIIWGMCSVGFYSVDYNSSYGTLCLQDVICNSFQLFTWLDVILWYVNCWFRLWCTNRDLPYLIYCTWLQQSWLHAKPNSFGHNFFMENSRSFLFFQNAPIYCNLSLCFFHSQLFVTLCSLFRDLKLWSCSFQVWSTINNIQLHDYHHIDQIKV